MLEKMKNSKGVAGVKNAAGIALRRVKASKAPAEQYLLALDIGTEFVKALIGKIEGDGIAVVGVGRAHQELNDMQAGAISDIAAVVQNCNQALAEAEEQAGVSVRSAVIGIAGELVKGTTLSVRCTRKDPSKPLDIEEIERIVGLVQQRALTKAKQQLAWELGGKEVEIRLVNSALVSIDIDGYRVTNPVGFQGRDVVVRLFAAFAPLIHIGALERTAQELDIDLLAVAAEPFAVARSVIGDDPNATMSAILMDVGGGTTDIAVLSDGGVQGTKMFGIGGRGFTRAIERDLDVDFSQAEALKLNIGTNKVPPNKTKAIEASLEKTIKVWMNGVELALGEFTALDHLPQRLLLCGGGSSLESLTNKLETSNWYTELPFTRKPIIQHIQPEQVVGIVDETGAVNDHTYITAMGLLRVGLDTLETSSAPTSTSSIRQRIDRILKV